jgi:photosystem I P700 chlorophyll a apoprotein A2
LWIQNPIATIPIAHFIWDPHINNTRLSSTIVSSASIYNQLLAVGFNSKNVFHLYNLVISTQTITVISIFLGLVHVTCLEESFLWLYNTKPVSLIIRLLQTCFDLTGLRLNFHISSLIGFLSIAWCGHLVHVAIPISRANQSFDSLYPMFTGSWSLYSSFIDKDTHIFRSSAHAGQAILTFYCGLKSNTCSTLLTDIAHHHVAVGILFVWATHVYFSVYKGLGHRIRDVFFVNNGNSMIRYFSKSVHLQLSLATIGTSVCCSSVAQHMYSLTPYLYMSYDFVSTVANQMESFFFFRITLAWVSHIRCVYS